MCGLCEWVKDLQCAIAVVVHEYDYIVLVTFKGTVSYTLRLTTHSCCAVDSTVFFSYLRDPALLWVQKKTVINNVLCILSRRFHSSGKITYQN
jgi:hypothetical protein